MEHNDADDFGGSVAWDTTTTQAGQTATQDFDNVTSYDQPFASTSNAPPSVVAASNQTPEVSLKDVTRTTVAVEDPKTELEGTKDQFVSFLVRCKVRGVRPGSKTVWC